MLSVSALGSEIGLSYHSTLSSANQGDAISQFNLGVMYERGHGVRQAYQKAKEWFGLSCDNGFQQGCDAYKDLNQRGF